MHQQNIGKSHQETIENSHIGHCIHTAESTDAKHSTWEVILRVAQIVNKEQLQNYMGARGAQWLRCCATNRKVAGSIPDGVIGIFH